MEIEKNRFSNSMDMTITKLTVSRVKRRTSIPTLPQIYLWISAGYWLSMSLLRPLLAQTIKSLR